MSSIGPQPGPQELFLATPADIAIYGGAAGGGKTYALLLECIRHSNNPGFGGVIFRRTSPQLVGVGSLWDEAQAMFRPAGAAMVKTPSLKASFPSGATIQFLHLQRPDDVHSHQGKQYPFIGFDELTHFTESQFWYLVSRMRSTCGVHPYMRCTTNPDPDSFVRELIDWWIGEGGYPIPERSGVLRWFVRDGGALFWGDDAKSLKKEHPGSRPMSLTFIAARLDDNPALTQKDPTYRDRLMALPEVERERLLAGNWDIRPSAGKYIKQDYFANRWIGELPELYIYTSSDFAVTAPREGQPDPDYTEHGVFGVDPHDNLYVLDWWHGQTSADEWIEVLLDKWARWKPIRAFLEGGVIRRAVEPFLERRMRERRVYASLEWVNAPRTVDTAERSGYDDRSKRAKAIKGRAFQARAAMGKVLFPANEPWADRVIRQCVGFPYGHDDAFDVMALMCMGIDEAVGARAPKPKDNRKRDGWDEAFRARPKGSWKTA